jgi:hypothetical protein
MRSNLEVAFFAGHALALGGVVTAGSLMIYMAHAGLSSAQLAKAINQSDISGNTTELEDKFQSLMAIFGDDVADVVRILVSSFVVMVTTSWLIPLASAKDLTFKKIGLEAIGLACLLVAVVSYAMLPARENEIALNAGFISGAALLFAGALWNKQYYMLPLPSVFIVSPLTNILSALVSNGVVAEDMAKISAVVISLFVGFVLAVEMGLHIPAMIKKMNGSSKGVNNDLEKILQSAIYAVQAMPRVADVDDDESVDSYQQLAEVGSTAKIRNVAINRESIVSLMEKLNDAVADKGLCASGLPL